MGADVQAIGTFLKTTDFEFVLRVLWHAQNVNLALGLHEQRTREAYESLRTALIAAVRQIHPPQAAVAAKLRQSLTFLSQFKTVVSLSYDLLLYWTILMGNEATPNRYKDCFVGGEFQRDWRRFRMPYGAATAATLVFYPHGSLSLGSDLRGVERKISTEEPSTLVETIVSEWQNARLTPLFVSEGTSDQKLRSIRRSPYLSTVYEDVLPDLGDSLVIFGWSLSDQDDHLLDAICKRRPRRVAVSVRRTSAHLVETMARVLQKLDARLGRNLYELAFFEGTSSGAWVS